MSKNKDIAVVIQGAFSERFTSEVVESVRKILPGSFIILSTWEGTRNISGVDVQINNVDPGANLLDPKTGQLNNLNRQIVSTRNGIYEAIKLGFEKVLKIRTDTKLTGCGFLDYFSKYPIRWEEYKVFDERIVICNKYVRPSSIFPFHISDWALFGKASDLLLLFDVPLEPNNYASWFVHEPLSPQHKVGVFKNFVHRYCAEQYLWINCIAKKYNIKFEHMYDFENDNVHKSDLALYNNFVVLSDSQFGVCYLKHKTNPDICITFQDWLNYYSCKTGISYSEILSASDLTNEVIKRCKRRIEFSRNAIRYGKDKIKNFKRLLINRLKVILIRLFGRIFCVSIENTRYQIRFSRFPVTKWIDKKSSIIELFFKYSPRESFFEKYNSKFDSFVLWELATGETTLLAQSVEGFIHSPDRTLFIFYRYSAKQVFDLITGGRYSSILLNNSEIGRDGWSYLNYISNKEVRCLFPETFWKWFWSTKKTFVSAVNEKFSIELGQIKKVKKNNDLIEDLKIRLKRAGINPDNFVILSPEANSVDTLADVFWIRLAKKLKNEGVDCFINQYNESLKISNAATFRVSLEELLQLSFMAKELYMLRSGLCEFLSQTGTPMTVFYPAETRFPYFFENYSCDQYLTESEIKEYRVESGKDEVFIPISGQ